MLSISRSQSLSSFWSSLQRSRVSDMIHGSDEKRLHGPRVTVHFNESLCGLDSGLRSFSRVKQSKMICPQNVELVGLRVRTQPKRTPISDYDVSEYFSHVSRMSVICSLCELNPVASGTLGGSNPFSTRSKAFSRITFP
jgi:hypothetical protein